MIQAGKAAHVIFDMDGTLSDTAKATSAGFHKLAKEWGFPPVTDEAIRNAMGHPSVEFCQIILPTLDDRMAEKFVAELDILEEAAIRKLEKSMLFPGIEEMLAKLNSLGIDCYIASTGSNDHVNCMMEATGLGGYFASLHCNEKRKGDMVRRILNGSDPVEWLLVGDKHIDASAARENKVKSLGAAFGYCTPADEALFDAVLRKPEDLFELVRLA
ncbi:HAD family hydrolase [Leadbettera azotonutricia]|uniref:phosphoglycolate phosphatase n=1 Tax=Leadbettera azotonutricia (strain ATCC BAA-888 / DSM 13862 / ZAS-9) TaxID=545695 RepID=F5YGE3_LEAAZ|nr:HAD family hydrolase [Leadbettera azotonutricia]AEF83414.1 putative phosphoglycolate phosphatase (PGPase) (PGP) [Leadbettera azotonutricia ZAS-9]